MEQKSLDLLSFDVYVSASASVNLSLPSDGSSRLSLDRFLCLQLPPARAGFLGLAARLLLGLTLAVRLASESLLSELKAAGLLLLASSAGPSALYKLPPGLLLRMKSVALLLPLCLILRLPPPCSDL